MKKAIRATIAILLALITAAAMPFTTIAASSTSAYTGQTYTHASRFSGYQIFNGIDVSSHNGDIDWRRVKASGIDYAIIRLGYTGYSRERFSTRYDTAFEYNISGARAAGLPVGVYWYSQAVNTSEARQEAQKLLAKLRSYSIDLPVFYDYEFAGVGDRGRLDYAWSSGAVNKATLTANAEAFCNEIQSAGYDAGVYASKSFLEDQIDGASLGRKYNIWLAHYNNQTPYNGNYYMWQYSSKGRVGGVGGNTDCNFTYLPKGASLTNNLKVSGITTSARGDAGKLLKISWGAISGATKYEIYDTTNGKNELKGTASTNEFTFTDLNPAWEYDIVVRAYCGRKTYSSLPHRICAAPAPVQNLELTATGHNSIKATWDYAVCHGYYIQWSTDPTFKDKSKTNYAWISGTYNTEYNISTHDAANKYYVRVRAWKYFQEGSVYSDFCEPAQIEGLVAPGEFAVTGRGDGGRALWLDWADVGGATEYDVYDVTNGASKLKGTSETSDFTFTDLNPAWEYDIKVVAKNAFENVESIYRVCAATPVVENFKAKITDNNSIKAEWDYAVCHGYYIQWSTDPTFTDKSQINGAWINNTFTTSFEISTDKPADEYYVRIRSWKYYQGSKIFSDFCEPAAPSGLITPQGFEVTGRGKSGTALWLDWDDVPKAESYYIYDVTNGANTLKGITQSSKFTFVDLNPAWEYDIKVVAKNGKNSSEATYRICAATAPVENFKASATGANTIKATWDYAVCHGYYIQWSTDPTFTDKSQINGAWINNTFTTSFEISTDKPADEYYVRIRSWKYYQGSKIFSDFCEPTVALQSEALADI